jgi:hypothetical protein
MDRNDPEKIKRTIAELTRIEQVRASNQQKLEGLAAIMTKLVFRSGGRSLTNGRAPLRKRELDVVIRVMLDYQGVGLKNQLTTRAGLAFELNTGMIWKRWNLLARKRQIFHSLSPRVVEVSPKIAGEPRLRDHPASLGASCNKLPSNQGNIRM